MSSVDIARELRVGPASAALTAWVLGALTEGPVTAIRHPLGFLCLPVSRGELNVCVHVWAVGVPRAAPTTSPVHCHSWDLYSYVLHGDVGNELVDVVEVVGTGCGGPRDVPTQRVFEIRSEGAVDRIHPTGRLVRWERTTVDRFGRGQAYAIPAGVFHKTAVPDGHEAATVVLALDRGGGLDQSLGPLDLPAHAVSRQRCDSTETARAVATVTRWLAAQHPYVGGRRRAT
jgi:hypothetical protein